jgi:hypothetical protein
MKKISSLVALLTMLIVIGTGCLKDKGFDDQKYGIQVSETKAVALVQAAKSPVTAGITGSSSPVTIAGPLVTLESPAPAPADVKLTLAYDDALVTAKGLTPLPAGSYSINTLNVTIPKDSSFVDDLVITINNSDKLDPTKVYGVGFKIASSDAGYQIAKNMSTVVMGIAIKNKYDGVYLLKGYHNRVPYTHPYETEIELVTLGPNSVYFYWPEVGSTGHPIGVSPTSMSWYGDGISPAIVFDPATDLVTDVFNFVPGTTITMFTGAGSRISKYDPVTKSITVDWNYNGNPLRAFFDDLTYIGPRD